ncbi:MAG TPA: TetR/AcrR family transcriptional regulator [Solirubrobacteraceae bacterium]|jgi:AcrR family transcriptional regulator|nr:TetR/AcrR family transcriptional regulator [Solirubrobacteraceae bacterium]
MASLPDPERLRPGRHHLAREEVARSQRDRMLVATLHCVADAGYPTTTVADIVAGAAVSRSTFYAQFADKEACFIAAYDFAMQHALARMTATARTQSPQSWRERVRNDLTTYLDVLADEPALATTLHVEVLAAGPAALEHRAELLGVLASRIANLGELAHRDDSAVRELPAAVFALFTGGLDELIRDRLRTGSSAALRDLAEPVSEATYAMFGA